MGNTLSYEEKHDLLLCANKIFKLEYNNLNVGNMKGSTGYIDYISLDDVGTNDVMIGRDFASRRFVVFKAQIEFSNGIKKQTFTTFFQRYNDNNFLYHCCGHHGIYLLSTEGGATLAQVKFLCDLLTSGIYVFGDEKNFKDVCINNQLTDEFVDWSSGECKYVAFPVKVTIGNS